MTIIPATVDDLPLLRPLYLRAMRALHAQGVAQWTQDYPVSAIPEDIERNELFVLVHGRQLLGAIVLNKRKDIWLNEINFTCGNAFYVHRLAIDPDVQGRGHAKHLMLWAHRYAAEYGGTVMRLDTHGKNTKALKLYQSLDYVRIGSIYDETGSEYIVHEHVFSK